jgi:hypothetical protein
MSQRRKGHNSHAGRRGSCCTPNVARAKKRKEICQGQKREALILEAKAKGITVEELCRQNRAQVNQIIAEQQRIQERNRFDSDAPSRPRLFTRRDYQTDLW